jgi:hypothetical protein
MFVWRYFGEDGEEIGTSAPFHDQDEAEAWLGETWRGLLDKGAEAVELSEEGGEPIYRMSLRPE